MIHYPHGFKIYRRQIHLLATFAIVILPLAFIALGGLVTHVSSHEILYSLGLSFGRLMVAYLISLILGTLIAVTLGLGKIGDFFVPVFDLLQNIPSFALIPVFALLFGYTNTMAVIFAVSSIIWPIVFYVLTAVRTARTDLNEAATVFGARGYKRLWHYLIPLSFPAMVTGSIVGISIGWEAIIGVEIIGLTNGIGVFLNSAAGHNRRLLTFGIVSLLLLVFSLNKLVWIPLLRRAQNYGE